jgi:succinate dehydrogenase/fumarate reductase cytochrome b subunit
MMRRVSELLQSLLITISTVPARVLALEVPSIPGLASGDGVDGIKDTIVSIVIIVLDFVMLLAVVFVIVAGIRLIVSGGDDGQKDTAKKTIYYVIAGIIVVLLARVIVSFVAGLFD